MKKIILIACLLFLSIVLFTKLAIAGTAYPDPIVMNQPDGTKITIILQGDENFSWAKTLDGYTLLYNDNGIYEYAKLDASGNLFPSGIKAHEISERSIAENSFLNTISTGVFYSRSQLSMIQQIANIHIPTDGVTAFPTVGNAKLLCILVGFSDLNFSETQANFHNLFNQLGYGDHGSVKEYYDENSYGQFNLTVDVAGPYNAPKTHHYYGHNDPGPPEDKDVNVRELVTWAVNEADDDVNYANYDNDGDGKVDGIYVIYAGYNEAEGGGADCIWYHAWSIPEVTLDGKKISSYSCSAEYKSNTGTVISGIGNICHEFGHVMGAPDFYDTNYDKIGDGHFSGTGTWDVMASGNFNDARDCPAHYNPYVKSNLFGWSTITTLNSQQELTIYNSALNNNEFYRVNTTTANEYFILENKQQLGFDEELPGHGLLIYHVHADVAGGSINITHPQKFYPVCANAGTEPSALPADYGNINSMETPFPGSGVRVHFKDAGTLPTAKSWAGNNTGKPIDFITENNSANTIDLCFMGCPPVAEFEAHKIDPCAGNQVNFTDLSEYPTTWSWTFSPTSVTYMGGTNASSQNPKVLFNEGGYYSVTLTVSNDYGSDALTKTDYIYVYTEPEVTLQPVNVSAEWGDNITFTAAASGDPSPTVQWQRSTDDGNNFYDISGATTTTLFIPCVTLEMSGYQYQAVFTNKCGVDWTDIVTLTVSPKFIAGTITITPNPQQYSDIVDFDVEIVDGYTCGEMAATGADIYIGTQYMGTVTFATSGSDLIASLNNVVLLEPTPYGTSPTGQMAPGPHTVTAYLLNVNPNFDVLDPTAILNILPEDARAYYTGALYVSTQGANSSDATVTLSATIVDITAVEPGSDPNAGDIRNATLSFIDRDGGIIASGVPIGLVDPNDPTVAVGTYDWDITITGDAEVFNIGVIIGGYYDRNSSEEDVVVTVAKPLPNFITGGGYIILENPAGIVAGDVGSKNNFGFNVKFNKNGTNLQGKVNTIIRRTELDGIHTYKIKGNKIQSLAIIPDDFGGEATINCKASIEDITDPLFPVSVEGNASMQINMDDNGEPGDNDLIAITIWDKWGGLWYASNWTGTITIQQLLDGGNLNVHSDNSFKAFAIGDDEFEGGDEIRIAPNPNSGEFTLMFGPVLHIESRIMIVDMKGQIIDEFLLNTNELKIDMSGVGMGIYQVIVFNGGEVYQAKVVIN